MDADFRFLNNKAQEFSTLIGKKLAFLDIELGKYVFENQAVIDDPILVDYKHVLEKIKL